MQMQMQMRKAPCFFSFLVVSPSWPCNGVPTRRDWLAVGFDTDQAFLAAEIDGDQLYFNAISRAGTVVDSGVIERRKQE